MRIFVALFDYDPPTMSPNPDACDEELPFREGQLIKVSHASRASRVTCHVCRCTERRTRTGSTGARRGRGRASSPATWCPRSRWVEAILLRDNLILLARVQGVTLARCQVSPRHCITRVLTTVSSRGSLQLPTW